MLAAAVNNINIIRTSTVFGLGPATMLPSQQLALVKLEVPSVSEAFGSSGKLYHLENLHSGSIL